MKNLILAAITVFNFNAFAGMGPKAVLTCTNLPFDDINGVEVSEFNGLFWMTTWNKWNISKNAEISANAWAIKRIKLDPKNVFGFTYLEKMEDQKWYITVNAPLQHTLYTTNCVEN